MEEQHVRSYLQIQETRYHDIMEYHILIDPELYGYQIPKMTFQADVEYLKECCDMSKQISKIYNASNT